MIDFDDRPSREDDATPWKKLSTKKSSNDVRPIFFSLLKFRYANVYRFRRLDQATLCEIIHFSFALIRYEYNNVKHSLLRIGLLYK